MDPHLTPGDADVLQELAEYQFLTVTQLAAAHSITRQMAARRGKSLASKGLVILVPRNFAGSVGRPEAVISLTEAGFQALRNANPDGDHNVCRLRQSIDVSRMEHRLLLNWTRLHLSRLEHSQRPLELNYLSVVGTDDQEIALGGGQAPMSIIPDGVFSIASRDQHKSLLFFLEIDMGSESLAGASSQSIRGKLESYQKVFRGELYKKFEARLDGSFRGFRVLFVANGSSRLAQLCSVVRSVANTGYVWLTDQESIFRTGIFDRIWVEGGRSDEALHSILGPTLAFESPFEQLQQSQR